MALSHKKANELLRYLNGQNSTIYIGLSTTTPSRDGTGYAEPSSEVGYKRMRLQSSQMSQPDNGSTTNVETIYFAEATGSWGTCTYFCLFSSAEQSEKDLVAFGKLPSPITPTNGKVPLIRANNLTMTM